MKPSLAATSEVSAEELMRLRALSQALDELLEQSLQARENLDQTFARLLSPMLALVEARAVVVRTLSEELVEETWSAGDFGDLDPQSLLTEHPWGVTRVGEDTLVSRSLDVVGVKVGAMALLFEGDGTAPKLASRQLRILETIAEELDTVLASVHTAAEKHQLIVQVNTLLSNRVFEAGLDQAILALAERVSLPGFMLVYRDAVQPERLHYRSYRHGHLEFESGGLAHPAVAEAIARRGAQLISPGERTLRTLLGGGKVVEAMLISGLGQHETLGKIFVWGERGFSAFTMDLLRLLASTLSQRLTDYNRERVHLGQFFSGSVIDELLADPDYERRYLTPREEQVGILFADINGFTRICEQVLERPERIGQFVDDWSKEVVDILWKHGGVFDKMVGDCVIGLFGPPFFKTTPQARAEAAVSSAIEIQAFTRERMSGHPEVARLTERVQLPGLGVAIGVNLANTFCGLFGPNRAYTGFSTGMNQTARLQGLGGFRETLVMDSVRAALEQSQEPTLRTLRFGPLIETEVKNVSQPLRYYALR